MNGNTGWAGPEFWAYTHTKTQNSEFSPCEELQCAVPILPSHPLLHSAKETNIQIASLMSITWIGYVSTQPKGLRGMHTNPTHIPIHTYKNVSNVFWVLNSQKYDFKTLHRELMSHLRSTHWYATECVNSVTHWKKEATVKPHAGLISVRHTSVWTFDGVPAGRRKDRETYHADIQQSHLRFSSALLIYFSIPSAMQ